jgi:protein TonB
MRKVYQTEKSATGLAMALLVGVGVTGVLFSVIPFSHLVAKPKSLVQLTSAKTIEAPPKAENEPPPPAPEPEKKEEAPPELKLAEAPQQIAISAELEVAIGGGGGLAGFGGIREMTAAETTKDDVFSVEELDKKPEPVSRVDPTYPMALRKAKVEGIVTLVFVLTEDGRVEDARVETSSRSEFEKPALDAIRKWRFRPGMKEGQAVRAFVRQPLRFRVPSAG